MSPKAEAIIEEFRALSEVEQGRVLEVIAHTLFSEHYGELSDEELTALASKTLVLLDKEES